MKIETYKNVLDYLKTIIDGSKWQNHVFAVGGCVRDEIMGNEIKDIDIVIDIANGGISFSKWLYEKNITTHEPIVYEQFGTAMFVLREFPDIEIEAVQTRKECYRDAKTRNPETSFGTIADDWTRRDFTINAIYKNISTGKFVDFDNRGINDIKNKIIRTCGASEIIFDEDSLRILRMVRFSSRLGFEIEEHTFESANKFVDRLSIISRERIYDEFKKMISTGGYYKTQYAICTLWDIGAFKYILPHLHTMKMLDRMYLLNRIGRLCQHYPPKFEEVMAAIMWGYDDAENELRGLKLSNDEIKEILFYINENKTLQAIIGNDDIEMYLSRKVMNECETERKFLTSTLVGSYEVYNEFHSFLSDDYDDYSTLYDHLLEYEKEYFTYEIPLTGEDVMFELEIGPCEKVGKALDRLKKFAFINKDHKSREDLLGYLKYLKAEL